MISSIVKYLSHSSKPLYSCIYKTQGQERERSLIEGPNNFNFFMVSFTSLHHEEIGERIDDIGTSFNCLVELSSCLDMWLVLFDWYNVSVTIFPIPEVIQCRICGFKSSDKRLFLTKASMQSFDPVAEDQ